MDNMFFSMMPFFPFLSQNSYLSDFDEEDIEYLNNQKVQDTLSDIYFDLLKLEIVKDQHEQDMLIDKFAEDFKSRLSNLTQEEQEYVKRKTHSVLMGPEEKTKEFVKEPPKDNK